MWPAPLQLVAPAHPTQLAGLRCALGTWLHGDHLAPDTVDDLVLAVSEAMENCCDHAFDHADALGTMSLLGREHHDRIVVTVDDDGRWRPATTGPTTRGRGMSMIRALVDEVEVATGAHGTRLTLTHHRPPKKR